MAVLKYSLLRLGVFALVFFGCLYLNLGRFTVIFAVIVGLVVSWAVGYLFFNSWRVAAGKQLAAMLVTRRRSGAEVEDNAAEDALADEFHEHQVDEENGPHQR